MSIMKFIILISLFFLINGCDMGQSKTENQYISEMETLLKEKLSSDYKIGETQRATHVKSHGLLKGYFRVIDNLPEDLKVGIFKNSKTSLRFLIISVSELEVPGSDINKETVGAINDNPIASRSPDMINNNDEKNDYLKAYIQDLLLWHAWPKFTPLENGTTPMKCSVSIFDRVDSIPDPNNVYPYNLFAEALKLARKKKDNIYSKKHNHMKYKTKKLRQRSCDRCVELIGVLGAKPLNN